MVFTLYFNKLHNLFVEFIFLLKNKMYNQKEAIHLISKSLIV